MGSWKTVIRIPSVDSDIDNKSITPVPVEQINIKKRHDSYEDSHKYLMTKPIKKFEFKPDLHLKYKNLNSIFDDEIQKFRVKLKKFKPSLVFVRSRSKRNISSEFDYSDTRSMQKRLINDSFPDLKIFSNCKIKEKHEGIKISQERIKAENDNRSLACSRQLRPLNLKGAAMTNKINKRKVMLIQSNSLNSSLSSIDNYNDTKSKPQLSPNLSPEKAKIKERITKIGVIPRFNSINPNYRNFVLRMVYRERKNLEGQQNQNFFDKRCNSEQRKLIKNCMDKMLHELSYT